MMNLLLPLAVLCSVAVVQGTADFPESLLHPVFLEHGHVINKRQSSQPIRITPFYDKDSMNFLTVQQQDYIKNIIMSNITGFFADLLSVRPLGQVVPIRSQRQCNGTLTTVQFNNFESFAPGCYGSCTDTVTTCRFATIPEEHLYRCIECDSVTNNCIPISTSQEGAGVLNSDYVLYVTAVDSGCGSNLAFAGPCTLEFGLNRPVVGYVNFCPAAFTESTTDELLITLTKHEMIHALGFLSNLYAFYREEDGTPRTPRLDSFGSVPMINGVPVADENTVRTVNYSWLTVNGLVEKEAMLIVTPRVVKEVRDHFGCQELEGAELEGEGGASAVGSHWDLRVFTNELMVPVIFSSDQPLSRVTLALLEDSGWYTANYELAENFLGNNKGCDFVQKSCLESYNLDLVKEENFFCFQENEQGCTATRDNIGVCWIVDRTFNLEPAYQYFSQPNRGGPYLFSEYCPFYMSTHACTDTNQAALSPISTNGANSRCFNHEGSINATTGGTTLPLAFNAGCYEYSCDNTGVYVTVGSTPYKCTERGQVLDVVEQRGVITYSVSILCPACETICWDRIELCSESSGISTVALTTTLQPTSKGTADRLSYILSLLVVTVTMLLFYVV